MYILIGSCNLAAIAMEQVVVGTGTAHRLWLVDSPTGMRGSRDARGRLEICRLWLACNYIFTIVGDWWIAAGSWQKVCGWQATWG